MSTRRRTYGLIDLLGNMKHIGTYLISTTGSNNSVEVGTYNKILILNAGSFEAYKGSRTGNIYLQRSHILLEDNESGYLLNTSTEGSLLELNVGIKYMNGTLYSFYEQGSNNTSDSYFSFYISVFEVED